MSSVSKRKGLSTSGSAVGVGAKRSKGGEARGNTNTEVGLKSPRVKDEATNRTHDVSKLPTTPIIQVQKSPVSVVKRINAGDHASSSIPQADTSATTSIGKDTKSDNDGHHSIGFLAVAYALAGLMALSWFDIPWTQHRCVVAAQAMGQATFSPEVWAALSWLGEGIRAQLYLYGPSDLALSENDPQPQLLLTHGIPMFFVLIALEWAILAARRWPKSHQIYRFNDALSSVLVGTFQQVAVLLVEVLLGVSVETTFYKFVYDHCRVATMSAREQPELVFWLLLLGKDLGYYAAHRWLHEYHVGWIGHGVHHSGEDYNLATALRQGALQPLLGWPFYLPLAIMGLPPRAFSAHAQLNTLYMFWIHTDLVKQLGALEYVLNTPSHHRVHHTKSTCNSNYAGMLIVWDRLFGTFRPELTQQDRYGLVRPPNSFDPISVNMHHFNTVATLAQSAYEDVEREGPLATMLRVLSSRRVAPRWVLHFSGLASPIPPLAIPHEQREEEALHVSGDTTSSARSATSASVSDGAHHDNSDLKTAAGREAAAAAAAAGVSAWSRHKWDGESPLLGLWAGAALLASAPAVGCSVALLVAARSMSLLDCIAACVLALGALSAAGRILDQRSMISSGPGKTDSDARGVEDKPPAKAQGLSLVLVPVLAVFLFVQPWASFLHQTEGLALS